MRKSNLATIAAAAVIVALSGGTGAVAAGHLIDGSDIKNGSITAKDLAKNSVKSSELADNSVKAGQLAPNSVTGSELKDGSVTTEALEGGTVAEGLEGDLGDMTPEEIETMKNGSGLDSNGDLMTSINNDPAAVTGRSDNRGTLPVEMGPFLLTANVTGATKDTRVTVSVGDDSFVCVAVPSSFPGTCSVSGLTNGGIGVDAIVEVEVEGDKSVKVELAATRG